MKGTLSRLLQKCFDDAEMSIMSSLRGYRWEPPDGLVRAQEKDVSEQTANADTGGWYPRIVDILKHVVECDEAYMEQAFGYARSTDELHRLPWLRSSPERRRRCRNGRDHS